MLIEFIQNFKDYKIGDRVACIEEEGNPYINAKVAVEITEVILAGDSINGNLPIGIPDGADIVQGATTDDRNASIDTTPATQTGILKYLSYLWQGVITAANTVRSVATRVVHVQFIGPNGVAALLTALGELRVMIQAHSMLNATDWSPTHGQLAYLGANSLTATGWRFTMDSAGVNILSLGVVDANNNLKMYTNGDDNVTIYAAGNIVYIQQLVAGVTTPLNAFLATDTKYRIAICYNQAGYDATTDTNKINEQAPLNAQYVEDSILDAVNVAAATGYYPSATGMKMDGYKDMTITGYIIQGDAITDTIEVQATNDEDTTDATAWMTIYGFSPKTNAMINIITTGGVAGTYPFALDFDNLNFANYRIKVVTGDSTNTVTIKMRRKAI